MKVLWCRIRLSLPRQMTVLMTCNNINLRFWPASLSRMYWHTWHDSRLAKNYWTQWRYYSVQYVIHYLDITNKNIATYNKSITFLTLVSVANMDMHDVTACLRKIFECNESITTLNASFVTMRLAHVNVDWATPAHTCRALWCHH